MLRCLPEHRNHVAALQVVTPQFRLQLGDRPMEIWGQFGGGTNLLLPELSLVAMTLPVVEDTLLAAVKAHGRHRVPLASKNNCKTPATETLQFASFRN